jgi:8-oxo-dGTP pyrophosphatase MutT (NUDIX family)
MYKVFFNSSTIFIADKLPEISEFRYDYITSFMNLEDLKPQVIRYLYSEKPVNLFIYHPDIEYCLNTFRSCFKVIPASGGLVKNNRKENLIMFRRGKWDLPKGKADSGESPEETALREVEEECMIKELEIKRYLTTTYHIYFLQDEPVLKETRWFEMRYNGEKEPESPGMEGIEKIIWLPFNQLDRISGNTFPTVLDVILAGEGRGRES